MSKDIKHEKELDLVIEGKVFRWKDQHITGVQAKKLAHLPAEAQLYLSLPDPWDDELIRDEDHVDLARPEIESFYVKRPLNYTLNRIGYESDRQFVRGLKLRQQGNIPADHQIYLVNKTPWEDELILDDDLVDLARPGTEHFISKPEAIDIILKVNNRDKPWHKREISFEEVVKIAYPNYDSNADKVYTVVYKKGPVQNPEGSMLPGQKVRVKNKMVFNVTETTRS